MMRYGAAFGAIESAASISKIALHDTAGAFCLIYVAGFGFCAACCAIAIALLGSDVAFCGVVVTSAWHKAIAAQKIAMAERRKAVYEAH